MRPVQFGAVLIPVEIRESDKPEYTGLIEQLRTLGLQRTDSRHGFNVDEWVGTNDAEKAGVGVIAQAGVPVVSSGKAGQETERGFLNLGQKIFDTMRWVREHQADS